MVIDVQRKVGWRPSFEQLQDRVEQLIVLAQVVKVAPEPESAHRLRAVDESTCHAASQSASAYCVAASAITCVDGSSQKSQRTLDSRWLRAMTSRSVPSAIAADIAQRIRLWTACDGAGALCLSRRTAH